MNLNYYICLMEEIKKIIVTILVGCPASGKSTWTEQYLKENKYTVRVSRDSFRYMFRNEGWTHHSIEKIISQLVDFSIIKALDENLNVIIDATNLKEKYINHFVNLVKYKADVEFKIFDTALEICLERDKLREKSVGEEVIQNMYKDWLNIKDKNIFYTRYKQPILYSELSSLENIVI